MPATLTHLELKPAFLPHLAAGDASANFWFDQVTTRLRREIWWLWQERGGGPVEASAALDRLPPFADRLASVLEQTRYAARKREFFASDPTAEYLTNLTRKAPPCASRGAARGSFAWVAAHLELSPVECFVLALSLLPAFDSSAGTVIAACLNDPAKSWPSFALAQRIWDEADEVLELADPGHTFYRHGLLSSPASNAGFWDTPLQTPCLLLRTLLAGEASALPALLRPMSVERAAWPDPLTPDLQFLAARLATSPPRRLRLIPLIAPVGAAFGEIAAKVAREAGLELAELRGAPHGALDSVMLAALLTTCWLRGQALFLPPGALDGLAGGEGHAGAKIPMPLSELPLNVFIALHERAPLRQIMGAEHFQPLQLSSSTYGERLDWWRSGLGVRGEDHPLAPIVGDCARRFRYEKETVQRLCGELRALDREVRPAELWSACRADIQLGELAQAVAPRFKEADLVLPPKQTRQIRDIIQAMRNLTRVHHEWGAARAWNECGLSALFAGPPGTGKTMAAEVIAAELDLPLYRIDLSQVVNKYIGETEKNLRRLFDAADNTDLILFFDEADSLFGKRTEVKDSHDRYANLEVSYLLERMERFKGLAILATNRKKDLDDAFLRRLRFLLDFPIPGEEERLRIWRVAIPPGVESADLNFRFLARQFPLTGGHIRAIVFHACLKCATAQGRRVLTMPSVIAAVKQEYDKLERATTLEQFGPYAAALEGNG